jgi:hypothetical protein
MRLAADLWARARMAGIPTSAGRAIDADVILAAQALALSTGVTVATGNPVHISRFVPSEWWSNIVP